MALTEKQKSELEAYLDEQGKALVMRLRREGLDIQTIRLLCAVGNSVIGELRTRTSDRERAFALLDHEVVVLQSLAGSLRQAGRVYGNQNMIEWANEEHARQAAKGGK